MVFHYDVRYDAENSVTYIDTSCGSDKRTLQAADRLAYRTAHVPQTMCHALFTRAVLLLERSLLDANPAFGASDMVTEQ